MTLKELYKKVRYLQTKFGSNLELTRLHDIHGYGFMLLKIRVSDALISELENEDLVVLEDEDGDNKNISIYIGSI